MSNGQGVIDNNWAGTFETLDRVAREDPMLAYIESKMLIVGLSRRLTEKHGLKFYLRKLFGGRP